MTAYNGDLGGRIVGVPFRGQVGLNDISNTLKTISDRDREKIKSLLGSNPCPELEYRYRIRPAGTGAWQLDDEYFLELSCKKNNAKNQKACKPYQHICDALLRDQ